MYANAADLFPPLNGDWSYIIHSQFFNSWSKYGGKNIVLLIFESVCMTYYGETRSLVLNFQIFKLAAVRSKRLEGDHNFGE